MTGKVLTLVIAISAIVAGALMYYLQVYGFYEEVIVTNVDDVQLTSVATGVPETILYENFKAIDAESSPLRYRACFDTTMSQAMLTETYVLYDNPVPLVAPGWFDCFDAAAIGSSLEAGETLAFLGTANIVYGFDRVVAIAPDGRGFVWHQMNMCGEAVFDGNQPPPGCPLPPERTE